MVLVSSIIIFNNFAGQNDINLSTQQGDSGEDDSKMSCSRTAEKLAEMLITIRNVIAKNQELINRDPVTGNYVFKDFVPAIVGTQVANDFSLKTGYRIKQTSLRVRNLNNEPDEWEKKVLKLFESGSHIKNGGYGEIVQKENKKVCSI